MTLKNRIPRKTNLLTRTPYAKQKGNGLSEDLAKMTIYKAKSSPRFQGENHAPQMMPDGSIKLGEYIGPGTQIEKRIGLLNSGNTEVRPVSKTDLVSMIHDCDYGLAQNAKNKEEQLKLVRQADEKMLKRLKQIKAKKMDNPANIFLGEAGIGSKVQIEKKGKTAGTIAGLALAGPAGALIGRLVGTKAKSTFEGIAGPLIKRPEAETNSLLLAKTNAERSLESQGVGSGLLQKLKYGKY